MIWDPNLGAGFDDFRVMNGIGADGAEPDTADIAIICERKHKYIKSIGPTTDTIDRASTVRLLVWLRV